MAWLGVHHRLWLLAAVLPHSWATFGFDVDPFAVVAGKHFSFFVNNQVAKATGRNNRGQLGIGSTEDQLEPTEVNLPANDKNVTEIAVGGFHSLFLTELGNVYAAGWNRFGQLGSGDNIDRSYPLKITVPEGVTVTGVAAGYGHSLFLLSDGSVEATGLNYAGQLGDSTTDNRNTLGPVNGNFVATKIAAGYDFSYFLMENGTVWGNGQNLGGQLGDGTRETRLSPVEVEVGASVDDITAGESHGLFLLTDKSVSGTGANFDGQLGDDTVETKTIPEPIDIGIEYDFVSHFVMAGGDSSCLICGGDFRLLCMGSNRDGQLGFGNDTIVTAPSLVPGVRDSVEGASVGDTHSLYLAHPGDVYITGTNTYGELGDETTNDQDTVQILMRLNFTATTKTSTTLSSTTTTSSTTETSTTTSTTSTTTVTPEVTRSIKSEPPDSLETMVYVGAVVLAILALLINVVCQSRADSRYEQELVAADEQGGGQMELTIPESFAP